jgi:cyanophycinase
MPIGGAEETQPGGEILERFVDLAGGEDAQVLVVPTASEEPRESGEGYIELFYELGVKTADWLLIEKRADAAEEAALDKVRQATGVFITGGDQARLVELLVGTQVMDELRRRNAEQVIIAGTSAGASILTGTIMVGGTGVNGSSEDAAARKGIVDTAAGLGLLQDMIIDQHFSQRGRMGRLLAAFAANPGLIGVGLDEDTAILIDPNGTLEVLGSSMVTIVDGRQTVSDYFEREEGEVLTVVHSSLHVLACGRRFDLNSRQAIGLNGSAPHDGSELATAAPAQAPS